MNRSNAADAGFTLIELIVAMAVIAAMSAGLAVFFGNLPAHSADPMVRAQARAIAAGYMEEILLQAYAEPDPDVTEAYGAETGEERSTYDDIWDYCAIGDDGNDCSGGDEAPSDQSGTPIDGLADYQVSVVIEQTQPELATVRITVSHSSGLVNYELASQRADY